MRERRFTDAFSEITSDKNKVVGYAAVFNSPTKIPDVSGRNFVEVVRPGAFSRHLKEGKDTVALFNHDDSKLLGRTSSGTLRLQEDNRGLWFEVTLPDTPTANELRALIERRDISGCSFAFTLGPKGERWGAGPTRELLDLDLWDVSLVTTPAYPSTSCDLRNAKIVIPQLTLLQKKLRLLETEARR